MRRPRAGDERSSHALGRRRGSAWWPIRAARQELADGAAVEACPQFLAGEAARNDGKPGGDAKATSDRETPDQDGGPESAVRRRHSVYDCGRSGRRRPQMSPGIEHVRVARRATTTHFAETRGHSQFSGTLEISTASISSTLVTFRGHVPTGANFVGSLLGASRGHRNEKTSRSRD